MSHLWLVPTCKCGCLQSGYFCRVWSLPWFIKTWACCWACKECVQASKSKKDWICVRKREVAGCWKADWQKGMAEQVMEMQSDRNALLVHPACLGGRRREGKPEDMLYTHTHIETHTTNTESFLHLIYRSACKQSIIPHSQLQGILSYNPLIVNEVWPALFQRTHLLCPFFP